MAAIKLQAQLRTGVGKNKVDKLRNADIIPAVIYSKGEETKTIQVDKRSFERVYKTAGTTSVIDLEIEGKTVPAIIKELQIHPFSKKYLHVDFQKLHMNEKVRLTVPIVLLGKDNIRIQPSVLMQQLDEVEIECLPKYIPEAAKVDVSNIDFNSPIYVSDLDVFNDENITVFNEPDELVANLIAPTTEEEAEETGETMVPDEVPVVGKENKEE